MRPSDKILATSEIILKLDRVTAFMHSPGSLPHAFWSVFAFPARAFNTFWTLSFGKLRYSLCYLLLVSFSAI